MQYTLSAKVYYSCMDRASLCFFIVPGQGKQVDNLSPEVRNKLGIREKSGVAVTRVNPCSPADDAGIKAGDVIREVNHKTVKDLKDYNNVMAITEKEKPVLLLMKRGGQTFYISMNGS